MMRVNHAGEISAQALYHGQALTARDPDTRRHLLDAAREERDHLRWCEERLQELDDGPSKLQPLWYAGSFTIGALAALRGDGRPLVSIDQVIDAMIRTGRDMNSNYKETSLDRNSVV